MLCFVSPGAVTYASTDEFRQVLQHGVDRGVYRELAVGWIDGDARNEWFFGTGEKPTAKSAFEIGAVTEVFTGLLLAQAVYSGKLRLNTTLGNLCGTGFTFADSGLADISLQSLATHRSGLRAVPSNLFPVATSDPYATYTSRDLLAWLANAPHAVDPGSTRYSILDSGLLGYLIGRAYAGEFAAVLRSHVLVPLGMSHTGFSDRDQLLPGYSSDGAVAPHWHFDALAGAGGLRSTLTDLLNFVQRNLRPQDSPLRPAMLLARRPYTSSSTPAQYGLGWHVVLTQDGDQTWPLVWSASRTSGFSAFIGFRTDRQQGLVLLGNTDSDLSAIGIAWLEGRPPPAIPPHVAANQKVVPLAEFAGLYQLPDGTDVIVRNGTAGLSAQWPGQAPIDMVWADQDVFVAPGFALTLSFQHEARAVASVVIDHAGVNVLARRLSSRAPHLKRVPLVIPSSLSETLVGDYLLDADCLVRIRKAGNGITLQLTGHSATGLHLFASDRLFTSDDSAVVTLVRNAAGAVTGLSLDFAGISREAQRTHWHVPQSKLPQPGSS